MKISNSTPLWLLLASCGLSACSGTTLWHDHVQGEGPLVASDRPLESFDAISMAGAMQLEIRVGVEPRLVIHAEENLQPLITTRVEDGVLKIKFEGSLSSQHGLRAEIDVPGLQALDVAGSSRIEVSGLQEASFEIDIAGSARGTFSGEVRRLSIDIAGSSNLDCFELQAEDVWIDIAGSGKVRTSAANSLEVDVAGSADVLYRGDPSVSVQQSGSSRVRQDDSEGKRGL